jgi:histidine ammonia-lyase
LPRASSAILPRTRPSSRHRTAGRRAGWDLRAPHLTSERLQRVMREIRSRVPHYDIDHYLAPDIAAKR